MSEQKQCCRHPRRLEGNSRPLTSFNRQVGGRRDHLPGRGDGGYLAFIGRISPEKGVEKAIKIARRVGIPLKIAAKVDKADLDYYNHKVKRLLMYPGVEFIGEIGDREKGEFLGRAMALLFPIDWPEPFGLVMIEAMANGTPVIAFRRGSVPAIIDEGVTGFVVDGIDAAVATVPRAAALDRSEIRRCFEDRFSVERMVRDYVELYGDVLRRSSINAVVLSTRTAGQREAA
ncbi:MAG: glycosyltransferase [Stellaceae bacterium]